MIRPTDCPPGAAAFVVLAGGSGSRMISRQHGEQQEGQHGGQNKVYLPLAGRPLLAWSLAWAAEVPAVGPVVLVRRPADAAAAEVAVAASGLPAVEQVAGGESRHRSEWAALSLLADRIGDGRVAVVAIHDGARPLAGAGLLADVIDTAWRFGGAVPTVPVDGIWPVAEGCLLRPPTGGAALHRVQTPQAFRAAELLAAYAAADALGTVGTDTASTVEAHSDLVVRAVSGSPANLKVTFAADLRRAAGLLPQISG